ncbi:tripartite tricarboxylate transporter permease [Geodermatophilus sp. CPCC 206100]|uniref:tripartite tricarboxylate transporter permease n=1 Tax=Geodermatophilus sp. CPCC 206100 TaxID=3020054 RepID=UPI003B006726
MIDSILSGFEHVTLFSVLWLLAGVLLGMVFGVLPGVGGPSGMTLLLPLTYGMEPSSAFALLIGIYLGAVYGGSVTSILLRIPGEPISIALCFDGYPLTQQGKSKVALGASIMSSATGGVLGGIALLVLLPLFGVVALALDSAAYFWIIVLSLLFIARAIGKDMRKGLIAAAAGLILGTIGIDPLVSVARYTMDTSFLLGGFPLLPLMLGMFGIAHMLELGQSRAIGGSHDLSRAAGGSMLEGILSVIRHWGTTARGTIIGVVVGALPGLGSASGNIIAYSSAQRAAGESGRFGEGDVRGVIAPEACNSASVAPSMIPTLSLGVPGSLSAAVLMGALVLHGLTPGRELVRDHADVIYGIVLFMLLGAALLLPLALGSVRTLARFAYIPMHILVPVITVMLVFGVFADRRLVDDVLLMVGIGIVAYFMELYGYTSAPLLIAFILGPLLETNLRRALLVGDGDVMVLLSKPLHWVLVIVVLLMLLRPLLDRPLQQVKTRLRRTPADEVPPAPVREDQPDRSA